MISDEYLDELLLKYENLWISGNRKREPLPWFPENVVVSICKRAETLLKNEPIITEVPFPALVIGDLHGNIQDLFRILRLFNKPPHERIVFLGDYVDRGNSSFHIILLLLLLYCKYPNHVTLLRGNHEFEQINRVYGFYSELSMIYNNDIAYRAFQSVFSMMSFATIIGKSAICLHGGLSPRFQLLGDIDKIQKPLINTNYFPAVSDVVWSDPSDSLSCYDMNGRGTGYFFGELATKEFLLKNKLKVLIRAHQFNSNGIKSFHNELGLTVFSATDYQCYSNRSGAIRFHDNGDCYCYSFGPENDHYLPKPIILQLNDTIGFRFSENNKKHVRMLRGKDKFIFHDVKDVKSNIKISQTPKSPKTFDGEFNLSFSLQEPKEHHHTRNSHHTIDPEVVSPRNYREKFIESKKEKIETAPSHRTYHTMDEFVVHAPVIKLPKVPKEFKEESTEHLPQKDEKTKHTPKTSKTSRSTKKKSLKKKPVKKSKKRMPKEEKIANAETFDESISFSRRKSPKQPKISINIPSMPPLPDSPIQNYRPSSARRPIEVK